MYAIKFQTTECRSAAFDKPIISREGQWHWIVREPEGWVWATSMSANGEHLPGDVKVFKSMEEAEKGCKIWETKYHPWYGKPNGVYEIVEIVPVYMTVQQGYKLA